MVSHCYVVGLYLIPNYSVFDNHSVISCTFVTRFEVQDFKCEQKYT